MYKIRTYNNISTKGLDLLPKEKYNVNEHHEDPDAIILRSFKLHDMEFNKSLKCIARAGAGVNNIPVEKCSENGVVVFNTPGKKKKGEKECFIT